jgi:C-terminal processing protease CtpA/Prc
MLRLAASPADKAPVSLGDAITGIDERSVVSFRASALMPQASHGNPHAGVLRR